MVFDPLHNVLSIGGTSQERLGKKASYNEAGPEMALNHGYPNFQQGVDANRLPPPRQHNGLAATGRWRHSGRHRWSQRNASCYSDVLSWLSGGACMAQPSTSLRLGADRCWLSLSEVTISRCAAAARSGSRSSCGSGDTSRSRCRESRTPIQRWHCRHSGLASGPPAPAVAGRTLPTSLIWAG